MKLHRKTFVSALESAASVADKKPQTPILANVLVRKSGSDTVDVIGSNLRTTISTSVPCESAESFTVKAHDIAQIVAKLDAEHVTIKQRDTKLEVSGGGAKFSLSMDQVGDWPELPEFDGKKSTEVESLGFAQAMDAAYAAHSDYTRPHLTGVMVEISPTGMTAISTDGARLAFANIKMDSSNLCDFFLPASAAQLIAKIALGNEKVSVLIDDGMLHVRSGATTISAKLLDAVAPPCKQFVENCWIPTPASVSRSRLIGALKRVSIAGDDKGISGLLTFAPGSIKVSAEGILNAAEETVPCEGGVALKARCNLRNLTDGLEHLLADDVEVHVGGELDPIIIRDAGMTQVALVMPMAK